MLFSATVSNLPKLLCAVRVANIPDFTIELKPICGKCVKSDTQCIYNEEASPESMQSESAVVPLDKSAQSMGMDSIEAGLNDLFSEQSRTGLPFGFTGNARMLHHFHSVVSLTMGSSVVKDVMHSFVPRIAWSQPYLMHMVLAVSAAHQKRLYINDRMFRFYSMAEASHWHSGLQLYRKHLACTDNRPKDAEEFDCVIATTFLAIIFTYALEDDLPLDTFISTDTKTFSHALDPLAATGGFRAVSFFLGEFNDSSNWATVLQSSDDQSGTFSREQKGIKGLPPAFIDLCNLNEASTPHNSPYHRILRLLTPLFYLEPSTENFHILFAFSGRAWPFFKSLLFRKDPIALLLLSYWLALLRQVDQWWLTTRAKTACKAIVAYLAKVENAKIRALLPFPASFGSIDRERLWEMLDCVIQERDCKKSSPLAFPNLSAGPFPRIAS